MPLGADLSLGLAMILLAFTHRRRQFESQPVPQ
jgi:hypothetical protein